MKTLFFVSLFVAGAYGCVDDCSCPNITTLFYDGVVPHEFGPGCAFNKTCHSNKNTTLYGSFSLSTIPTPPDADEALILILWDYESPAVGPDVSLMDAFGIVCDSGSWYATKLPFGVVYPRVKNDYGYLPASEVDGKGYKAQISDIVCYD